MAKPVKNDLQASTGVSIEKATPEQLRIMVLEGQLAATEKRLLEYVHREEKLREKLRERKGE